MFERAQLPWPTDSFWGGGLGLRIHSVPPLSRYLRTGPLTAEQAAGACIGFGGYQRGMCFETGCLAALLASAMRAFCPQIQTEWVSIENVPMTVDSIGRVLTWNRGHVFVSVRTPKARIALDLEDIGWRHERHAFYDSGDLRAGSVYAYYHNKVRNCIQLQKFDEARRFVEILKLLKPTSPMTLILIGEILLCTGDLDGAVAAMKRAVEGHENPFFFSLLAYAQAAKGEIKDAMASAGEAVRLAPSEPKMRIVMAHIFEAAGRWQDAANCYQTALQLDPGMEEARESLRKLRTEHRVEVVRSYTPSPERKTMGTFDAAANAVFAGLFGWMFK